MNTQKMTAALALALALGAAAPAFADNSGRFPGLEVERLTEQLQEQQVESENQAPSEVTGESTYG